MNLYANQAKVLYYLLSITTPIFCLYEDLRIGVEADVNGKQEEKYDDSLISSHNFRKQHGDTFTGWRRSNNEDPEKTWSELYRPLKMSFKNQISKLRRSNVQKPKVVKETRSANDEIIDVKFRKDTPQRRTNYDVNADFAYHDKMESAGAGDVADFERNLKAFEKMQTRRNHKNAVDYLHGEHKPSRRSGVNEKHVNNEKEILFHHAVPIDMKIYGYFQLPLEE